MGYKDEFSKNGVCVLSGFFPIDTLKRCLDDLMKYEMQNAIDNGDLVQDKIGDQKYLKYFQYVNAYIRSFDRLNSNRLLQIASDLLDQDVYFTSMGVHNKAPNIGTVTPAHQDNFYSCRNPPDFVTAYIPLLPMSVENGGIQYALGSHKNDVLPHHASSVPGFSSGIEESAIEGYEIFQPILAVGDVVFHHGNLIHFANANTSKNHRYAVAIGIFGENAMEDVRMRERYMENLRYNKATA